MYILCGLWRWWGQSYSLVWEQSRYCHQQWLHVMLLVKAVPARLPLGAESLPPAPFLFLLFPFPLRASLALNECCWSLLQTRELPFLLWAQVWTLKAFSLLCPVCGGHTHWWALPTLLVSVSLTPAVWGARRHRSSSWHRTLETKSVPLASCLRSFMTGQR